MGFMSQADQVGCELKVTHQRAARISRHLYIQSELPE